MGIERRGRRQYAVIVAFGLVACVPEAPDARNAGAEANPAGHGGDLTGTWTADQPPEMSGYAGWSFTPEPPPMTEWARERYAAAKPTFGPRGVMANESNDPVYECFPAGTPRIYFHPFPVEIIQTPGRVLMLYEYDHSLRQIYTDGREHRTDLAASWMGDSTGHWEGDTLVVETVNLNDKTWLDREGLPHSDELRIVERFTRVDEEHLELEFLFDDPVAFLEPWTARRFYRTTEWEIEEFVCQERNQGTAFEAFESEISNYDEP